VLYQQGRTAEAIQQYREALRINDDFDGALNNLAWILATTPRDDLRDGSEAVRLAERACELSHNLITVQIGTLAAAYAEAGRFDEAVATGTTAIRCARLRNEAELAELYQQLVKFYRLGRPYHSVPGANQ
jgi:tetratricopeptide (TPR) repeat protein